MRVFLTKTVVESVEDEQSEISLEEAQALSEDFEVGDMMEFELTAAGFWQTGCPDREKCH